MAALEKAMVDIPPSPIDDEFMKLDEGLSLLQDTISDLDRRLTPVSKSDPEKKPTDERLQDVGRSSIFNRIETIRYRIDGSRNHVQSLIDKLEI